MAVTTAGHQLRQRTDLDLGEYPAPHSHRPTDRDYWRNQSTGLANVDEPAASDAKSTEVPRKTSVTDPNEHLVRRQRFAKLR